MYITRIFWVHSLDCNSFIHLFTCYLLEQYTHCSEWKCIDCVAPTTFMMLYLPYSSDITLLHWRLVCCLPLKRLEVWTSSVCDLTCHKASVPSLCETCGLHVHSLLLPGNWPQTLLVLLPAGLFGFIDLLRQQKIAMFNMFAGVLQVIE